MAATGTYVTQADCENRFTSALIVSVFDDDATGVLSTGEEGALSALILDAENIVEESIHKTYGDDGLTWLRAQTTSAPRSVKRRILDVLWMYIVQRHPEFVRVDLVKGWERVNADLAALRLREVSLAVIGTAIEPADNEGGYVRSGDPDDTEPKPKVFLDGTGIF